MGGEGLDVGSACFQAIIDGIARRDADTLPQLMDLWANTAATTRKADGVSRGMEAERRSAPRLHLCDQRLGPVRRNLGQRLEPS